MRTILPHRLKSFTTTGNSSNTADGPSNPTSRSSSPKPSSRQNTNSLGPDQLMLRVRVIKGQNLAPKDKDGLSDPYLVLILGESRQSTVTIPKTLDPEWNDTIEMPVTGPHSLLLEGICWDKDRFGKDYMGEFDVSLDDVFLNEQIKLEETWYQLESRKTGKKKSVVTGGVLLELSLFDPLNASASTQSILAKFNAVVSASKELHEYEDPSLARTDSGGPSEDDDEDNKHPTDAEEVGKTGDGAANKKKNSKLTQMKRKAKQKAYEFSGLTDLAGILFVEINKITDLPPERNMTRTSFDMDPFVVSSLGKKTYRTRVIRHNLNPVFDEKLVFQVMRHEKNYTLNFSVIDRDKLSGNDFIGTTQFPLEQVTSLAADPDPETGLYPVKDYGGATQGPEGKKSRFRLPLSRTGSSSNISKMPSRTLTSIPPPSPSSQQQPIFSNNPSIPTTPTTAEIPASVILSQQPTLDQLAPEDPDLRLFELPISLKNKDRWEEKNHPVLYVKAKYVPYKALRQQFWRAMLRQYDADESGYINRVELTTMLDTLGSTLHESTIDGFFEKFESEEHGEPAISFDHAVRYLEELLQQLENQHRDKSWRRRVANKHPLSRQSSPGTSSDTSPERSDLQNTKILSNHSDHVARTPSEEEAHVARVEMGEHLDANDLQDEREEEHIVEIRECPICHQPRLSKRSDSDIITHIATCASQDWRQVNNIVMAGFVTASQAQRKWYSKVITKISYGGYKLGANSANILVQDRITGQISEERMSVYVRLGIRLLYKGLKSREMEKKRIRKLLRSLSYKQGRKYDDPASAAEIQGFINFHQLDMTEVKLPTAEFKNFNQFFYRELKPDARPCSAPDRPEIVTSPADCRSVVFNEIDSAQGIWVKGREFSVERLLGNAYPEDAKRYTNGGALGIFRLAPQDYHRFHVPVDGVMDEPKLIEGEYYTVNPMAIRSALDVYGENVRVIVPIDSVAHGRVMVICVGAMMVGSTVITRKTGEHVKRAEELGYFKFGGSTLLCLFEPGMVEFDSDLHDNSSNALETLIRVGMSIGHSPEHEPHTPDMQKEAPSPVEKAEAARKIKGGVGAGNQEKQGHITDLLTVPGAAKV